MSDQEVNLWGKLELSEPDDRGVRSLTIHRPGAPDFAWGACDYPRANAERLHRLLGEALKDWDSDRAFVSEEEAK